MRSLCMFNYLNVYKHELMIDFVNTIALDRLYVLYILKIDNIKVDFNESSAALFHFISLSPLSLSLSAVVYEQWA